MKDKEKIGSLRWMMIVPIMLLVAAVLTEISNCHHARLAIKADLNSAIETLATVEDDYVARQDTIRQLEQINYAMAQPIFAVADQKLPGTLFTLSALSMMSITLYCKRRKQLVATHTNSCTIDNIKLTPMQRQLVDMLWCAPNHCVPKRDICAKLWGSKDNAEESLYTLVRRTKKVIAEAGMEIVCNRGESYQLQ